jgi:hypothetical protein
MTHRALPILLVLPLAGLASLAGATGAEDGAPLPSPSSFVLDGGDSEASPAAIADEASPTLLARVQEAAEQAAAEEPPPTARPTAYQYSEGYATRLKVHKYASFATLPIFVAQAIVGQKLYDGDTSLKGAHTGLVAATAGLFAVNTVTGVWNLREGRKDPNHRTKRMIHGLLMFVADAGFVATGVLAPHEREVELGQPLNGGGGGDPATHRAVAYASMGVATVSYLMMLVH